ncbi:MAG: methyltransferase domain-containing protein [Myxococcota bacterium]
MSERDKRQKGSPHSSAHLGAQREHWWNNDFLALLGQRMRNAVHGEVKTMLDVGAGKCHWTAITARWFPNLERVVASDVEDIWARDAQKHFAERYGPHTFKVEGADADALELPFPDDLFDFVTCQTVLMHVADAEVALREMVRVTRPGGVVCVAEPANFRNVLELDSAALGLGLETQARRMRLWLACRLGRARLGDPDFDVGERLAPLMQKAGLEGVRVVMNDRVRGLAPPYDTAEQKSLLAYLDANIEALLSPAGRLAILRLATAGGMHPDELKRHMEDEATHAALRRSQVQSGRYYLGGAPDMFIAWGNR